MLLSKQAPFKIQSLINGRDGDIFVVCVKSNIVYPVPVVLDEKNGLQ